jgi:hypothetical protein
MILSWPNVSCLFSSAYATPSNLSGTAVDITSEMVFPGAIRIGSKP